MVAAHGTVTRRAALGGIAGAVMAAVAPGLAHAQSAPLSVVATTGMIADTARRIGGDRVQVRALMGPGVDPHAYRQTRTDIAALARADLVLWHGLYLEAQMEEVMLDLARRRKVVAVAEAVPVASRRAHDEYKGRFDPHVWMDPVLWQFVADAIAGAMGEARPADRVAFEAEAARYRVELQALAAYSTRILATVPSGRRVLVTAHDAFAYFGAAYGFEVMGIQGISTESEAGLARIRSLVDLVVERRIGAIFVESSVAERNVRAIVEGAAARGHTVIIAGELYSDAMGPDGTYEGTYIGMIDHNVTTIARALGGEAPMRGLNGRLAAGG
jgi:manganese/zinc/iron transport system substrate-binding protein